jgi:hypothetical protein
VKGGFFLRKKPLEYVLSVYTISENAVAVLAAQSSPESAMSSGEDWRQGQTPMEPCFAR